jgi:tRNA threonylcarbamoyladenosine biosynthesis protein TsaE
VQTYELGDVALWHADLYRLGGLDELAELGLDEAFAGAIAIVEWAERLGPALPARRLAIGLGFADETGEARLAALTAIGPGWDWLAGAITASGLPAA